MLRQFSWPGSRFSCLEPLWERESGWGVTAGTQFWRVRHPQALSGSLMASAGPDWHPMRPPRSAGASPTSRAVTARPAVPGRTKRPTAAISRLV